MALSKVYSTCDEAVADVPDGATIMFGGFGLGGTPINLIAALARQGARRLTTIANGCGGPGAGEPFPSLGLLFANSQVRKAIASFPAAPAPLVISAFERQYLSGEVELEVVPQGTLAERIRAAGAGIPAFYTPTGVGTDMEAGKEKRVFNGREYVLEHALKADYAFIRALKADPWGNLVYRMTSRNFNPIMATAAQVTIAEVEEIVGVGELDPEAVVTPCIYVHRIVRVPPIPREQVVWQ